MCLGGVSSASILFIGEAGTNNACSHELHETVEEGSLRAAVKKSSVRFWRVYFGLDYYSRDGQFNLSSCHGGREFLLHQ